MFMLIVFVIVWLQVATTLRHFEYALFLIGFLSLVVISIINSAHSLYASWRQRASIAKARTQVVTRTCCWSHLRHITAQRRRGANRANAIRIDYGRHARPAMTSRLSASDHPRCCARFAISLHTQPNDYARWTCDWNSVGSDRGRSRPWTKPPVGHNPLFCCHRTEPGGRFFGKLALTRTPDLIWPTRRDPDPNRPTYDRNEGFVREGVMIYGFFSGRGLWPRWFVREGGYDLRVCPGGRLWARGFVHHLNWIQGVAQKASVCNQCSQI